MNKVKFLIGIRSFDLQRFAEDAGGTNNTGGQAGSEETEAENSNAETMSFDDMLKNKGYQAEFDRRTTKAIQTAVENARKKWELTTSDKVSEAERLAQMNAEEKAEYRAKKAEDELAELKRTIARTELASKARAIMTDEGVNVPDVIVNALVADDAETTKDAVEGFCKVFKDAVADAVKNTLKSPVPQAGSGKHAYTKSEIMAIKDRAERRRLIAENPQLFSK